MRKYIAIIAILLIVFTSLTYFLPRTTQTPTPSPTPTQAVSITEKKVHLYFVALEDNGVNGQLIGCNDSIIPVEYTVSSGNALRTTLEYTLSLKNQSYDQTDYYNPLYQSRLVLKDIKETHDKTEVYLEGQLLLNGVCDNPRVKAQLEETVKQFATNKSVKILVNNQDIDKALSLK